MLVKSPWSCQGPEIHAGLSGVWCLVSHVWFLVFSVCCLQEYGVWWSFSGAAQAREALQANRRETEAWLVASGI